jgi:hypothetical protein
MCLLGRLGLDALIGSSLLSGGSGSSLCSLCKLLNLDLRYGLGRSLNLSLRLELDAFRILVLSSSLGLSAEFALRALVARSAWRRRVRRCAFLGETARERRFSAAYCVVDLRKKSVTIPQRITWFDFYSPATQPPRHS